MLISYLDGNEIRIEYQDAIVRDPNEDATSSFQMHVAGWRAFRVRHPGITATHLRTDGASCYSGELFCKLLPLA